MPYLDLVCNSLVGGPLMDDLLVKALTLKVKATHFHDLVHVLLLVIIFKANVLLLQGRQMRLRKCHYLYGLIGLIFFVTYPFHDFDLTLLNDAISLLCVCY